MFHRLRNKDVFALIQKHSLYTALSDQIKPLMTLDSQQATKLLLDNLDKIPVSGQSPAAHLSPFSSSSSSLAFMCLAFACMPSESCHRGFGSLLLRLCDVFQRQSN